MKRRIIKSALVASAILWTADIIYKLVKDISYVNREQCVLFRAIPRPAFVLFEYVFETMVIVFVGTFIAVWLSRQFQRLRRFFPRNPLMAFLWGAVIPVCSCGVIPLVASMRGRLRFTTMMAFIVAAPLLSPYIIVLSFSVLGFTYGVVRILSAFVLTMVCAFVVGFFERRSQRGLEGDLAQRVPAMVGLGCAVRCNAQNKDIYLETLSIFRGLLPYLVVAGGLGVALEYLGPRRFLLESGIGSGMTGVIVWTLIGVPLYFCNGAEVLFLRPLVSHGFPIGTAVAFSLTSTAVCTTSIAMLFKVIGVRLTLILVACVMAVAIGLALVINLLL